MKLITTGGTKPGSFDRYGRSIVPLFVVAALALTGGAALATEPVYGSAEADAAVAGVTALKAWGLPLLFTIGMSFIAFAWLKKVGKPKG